MSASDYSILLGVLAGFYAIVAVVAHITGDSKRDVNFIAATSAILGATAASVLFI